MLLAVFARRYAVNMPNIAPVKWAQRTDSIYVTINLPDVTDEKIDLTNNSLKFRYASSHGLQPVLGYSAAVRWPHLTRSARSSAVLLKPGARAQGRSTRWTWSSCGRSRQRWVGPD